MKTFVIQAMNMGNNGNMGGNMTMDDDGSMVMTFDKWNQYRLQILFATWNVQSPWQFALSWFVVAFAAAFLHVFDCVLHCFDISMQSFLSKKGIVDPLSELDLPRPMRPVGWNMVKIIRGLISAMRYSLSLFLMLVAMTFNPSLFLALFVGYWFGDILLCDIKVDLVMHKTRPLFQNGGVAGSIIRWALCVPVRYENYVRASLYPPTEESSLDGSQENSPVSDHSNLQKYVNYSMWLLPRVISLIFLIVLLVWIVNAEGGFGYQEASVFGWHALLMSFFVVMFTNEAILTYKAPLIQQLANSRTLLRYFHNICHIGSIACIILGLIAISDYKIWSNSAGGPVLFPFYTMYSPHSWLGVLTISMFGVQIFYAFAIFYLCKWPEGTEATKQKYVEIHHFIGHCMYALGLATCATGFQDMQSSDLAAADMGYMLNASFIPNGHDDVSGDGGYNSNSVLAHLSSTGAILLLALGVSTFAALRFLPRVGSTLQGVLAKEYGRKEVDSGLHE